MKAIKINSWNEFQNIIAGDKYRSWAFRGQADTEWKLESTLSRYLKDYNVFRQVWDKQERRIFRIFKRKAHQFLSHLPKDDDAFEWLSTMKHHGAPTRLLDFTWSPYVATFFALEHARKNAAIWAIYPPGLKFKQSFPNLDIQGSIHDNIGLWKQDNYEKYYLKNKYDFVTQGEPYRMNRRLIAQSGTFIVPSRIDKTVEEIIIHTVGKEKSLVKFELKTSVLRHHTLRELYNMNITNATLFPDLDGLARSMALEYEFHYAFDPITGKKIAGFE